MQKYFPIKKLIMILILSSASICQTFPSDSTMVKHRAIGYDKIQHAAVSCLLTLSGQYVLETKTDVSQDNALMYSASSSAMIGLTKELNDMKTRSIPFDWGDMLANFVGIGLAIAIIAL